MKSKIIAEEDVAPLMEKLRAQGKRIVFLNGSFDIVHAGHLYFLESAKRRGDVLFVALNGDESVQTSKRRQGYEQWKLRPFIAEDHRAQLIASLWMVDYVSIFNDAGPFKLIEAVKPHVYFNGAGYPPEMIDPEINHAKKFGAEIVLLEKIGGLSTSDLVRKIRESKD